MTDLIAGYLYCLILIANKLKVLCLSYYFMQIPIIVREGEPSSLIAYTLASAEYEQKLQELKQNLSSNLSLSQKDSQASSPLLKHKTNRNLSSDNTNDPFSSDDTFGRFLFFFSLKSAFFRNLNACSVTSCIIAFYLTLYSCYIISVT